MIKFLAIKAKLSGLHDISLSATEAIKFTVIRCLARKLLVGSFHAGKRKFKS